MAAAKSKSTVKPLNPTTAMTPQTTAAAVAIPALAHVAAPNNQLPASGVYRSIATSLLQNYSYTIGGNTNFLPTGDLDEPYDAADATDFHLAYRNAGAASGDDIIPSFHRPAVINAVYSAIVNDKGGLSGISEPVDLFATIELLQRACGRPLSFRVRNVPPAYALPGGIRAIAQNPNFSGSNQGEYNNGVRTPQLDIDWAQWTNQPEREKFENWVRWLIRGPWDVDTDSDGLNDANWVDINLPLMTSPEGKLLKIMAAYYVEDLGGRLNLNANGNWTQAEPNFEFSTSDATLVDFNRYAFLNNNQLPQGLGYGTADISLRHLFGSIGDYRQFLAERNGAPPLSPAGSLAAFRPGQPGNDLVSLTKERHRLAIFNQNRLPGLPMSVFGRTGLGVDLFGNPVNYELVPSALRVNQILDDPYEAHVLTGPHQDQPYTFAEWERLERVFEADHSTQPRRLQRMLLSGAATPTSQHELVRSVTPDSNSTIAASFGGTYAYDRYPAQQVSDRVFRRVSSFKELVEKLAQDRFTDITSGPAPGTYPFFKLDTLSQLFPVEFGQNLPLDLNRPLGNGFDDDGDFLVDEPDEVGLGQYAEYAGQVYNGGSAPAINELYAPGVDASNALDPLYNAQTPAIRSLYAGNDGRQLLARHLYCLAQLILPNDYVFPNQPDPTMPLSYGDPTRARILAQWAVNVVDYRDMDAAMTRFPYDADPLRPDASTGRYWDPDPSNTNNGVVWGYEKPELLMTETFAFHDMRIYEQQNPPPGGPEWKQMRTPEGSLFLEFMCTASSDPSTGLIQGQPGGRLYQRDPSTGRMGLALSALTPPLAGNPQFPVWRVLLTQPDLAAQPNEPNYAVELQYNDPATRATLQYQFATQAGLEWNTANPGPTNAPEINRVVWFTDIAPNEQNVALPGTSWFDSGDPDVMSRRVFRNFGGNNVFLHGGQYLVVGPRSMTYLGQREKDAAAPDPVVNRPSLHRIELTGNWVQFWNEENHAGLWHPLANPPPEADADTPPPSNFLEPCVTMIASTDRAIEWEDAPGGEVRPRIGLNISEPTPDSGYYADANLDPLEKLNTLDTSPDPETGEPGFGDLPPDAYLDLSNPAASSPHKPLDLRPGSLLREGGWPEQDPGGMNSRPNVQSNPIQPMAPPWSTAVLQRLANPDRPWHQALNPYVTVDWMSIDLTVFNGTDTAPNTASADRIPSDAEVHLSSCQKSGVWIAPNVNASNVSAADITQNAGKTLYSYHPGHGPRTMPNVTAAPEASVFNYQTPLEYWDVPNTVDMREPRLNGGQHLGEFVTLGYLNSRYGLRGLDGGNAHPTYPGSIVYAGPGGSIQSPSAPAVMNRDFVSAHELMNVPFSSPGQMLQDFTPAPPTTAPPVFAFNHLLDFDMTANSPNGAASIKSAAVLFDLVGTRNPWVDADKLLDPADTYVPMPNNQIDQIVNAAMAVYRPPFNRLSQFVEPGKINLNTASEVNVLRGLMSSAMTPSSSRISGPVPYQAQLAQSRSNFTSPGSSALSSAPHPALDQSLATRFPGVFKPGMAATSLSGLAAGTSIRVSNPTVPPNTPPNTAATGLLRQDPGPAGNNQRLFGSQGLFPGLNPPYNPLFSNYPVTRLTNLTSSNSNVYEVRIVLGYFEYSPATGLGREYGEDEGRVRRHKAFYVIDRSIPVGYEPGKDHNVKDCILLQRFVE